MPGRELRLVAAAILRTSPLNERRPPRATPDPEPVDRASGPESNRPAVPPAERARSAELDVLPGKKCAECGNKAMIRKDGCDFCTACGAVGTCG